MHYRKLAYLIPLIGCLAAPDAETLSGRIVNPSVTPLAGAKVWLKSRPEVFDSTGVDGRFELDLTPSALRPDDPSRASGPDGAGFRLRDGRLSFVLERPQDVTVEVHGLRGERVAVLFRGRLGPGHHARALHPGKSLSPGRYVLALTRDGSAAYAPVRLSGTDRPVLTLDPEEPAGSRAVSKSPAADNSAAAAKTASAADTLLVLRMGHEIKKLPVTAATPREVGDVSLSVRSYRRDTAVTVKAGRRIEVYVPSDYRELYRLPVLYLVHGRGANETYWRVNCKFFDSLNTFSDRLEMQPMIIVTPSAGGASNVGYYGKTADPFMVDLTVDIRAYVESRYKADTARMARAISGLSMGAIQTWNLTYFYPELWGYSVPMSGGLLLSEGFSAARFRSDVSGQAIDVDAVNRLKLFKVYSNPTDIAYSDTDSTSRLASSAGIRHTTDFTTRTGGGHTDPYWNEVFRKMAPLLFK